MEEILNKIKEFISKKPYASILILILAHMVTCDSSYKLALIWLENTGPFGLFRFGFVKGLYGWFVYASAGMVIALVLFSPFIYYKSKNILNSINYALALGLGFRIASYYTSYLANN